MIQEGMGIQESDDEITIDLGDLFKVIIGKLPAIILSGLLFAIIAFVGTKAFVTEMYTSETKVYILSRQSETGSTTYNDLVMGSYLTKDFTELIKSRPVMEHTIQELGLDMSVNQLKKAISITAPEDTRILGIAVTHPDPELAKEIADVVRESSSVQITKIMDAEAVNVVEEANLPTAPSSPNVIKNSILGGMLGVILALGIIVLVYMLDDTIKTSDDVEKYLGLNVLTSIPLGEGEKRSKKAKKKSSKKHRKRR